MSDLPIVDITVDGKTMPGSYHLLSLETVKLVNKIPFAQLRLVDGDAAIQDFIVSSGEFFKPGIKVDIKLNFQGDAANTVFVGLVISHNIKSSISGSVLVVELQDECSKLNGTRQSAVYTQASDSKVIERLVKKSALTVGAIDETEVKHQQLVQYQCCDWDFILNRADVSARLVIAEEGRLALIKPQLSATAHYAFNYGISDCIDFDFSLNISQQYKEVQASGWASAEQQLTSAEKGAEFSLKQGNINAADSAKALARNRVELNSSVFLEKQESKAWADARMLKNRLAMFRGTLTVTGDSRVKLADLISIKGVGDRFNGNTLITGISHTVTEQGWQTRLQFGLSADWYSVSQANVNQQAAAGLLPAISGLQVGIVEPFCDDPQKLMRVKVKLPALENSGENTVWARMAMAYAGNNKGLFFTPDPGDEVIVGFINDDPRQALILGGCFSEKKPLPRQAELNKANAYKGIISRSDLRLSFDDEKKQLSLSTPGNNRLLLDDENKTISVTDPHNNKIVMSDTGITISSDKSVNIEAGEKVNISGKQGVKITALQGDVTTKSLNIQEYASGNFLAEAKGAATVKGDALLNLEGALVMIN